MYPKLAMLIDGEWLAKGEGALDVVDPATGLALAQLPTAGEAMIDRAVDAAVRAFPVWREVSAYERGRLLRRAADLVRERAQAIAGTLSVEQGKPIAEALGEVLVSADVLEWYAEEGRRTYGRIIPGRAATLRHHTQLEPVGPAAAFTPWNFPALTPARKIGGALAAGCSLVLKPSEETPGTAVELARAITDAGVPAGVLNLIFGDPPAISRRVMDREEIRKVSFTGSTAVGKQLLRLASDSVKSTTMELGGHAPVIVCADADADAAALALAAGKFRNAGQVCISPTRFFVHESLHDRFVRRFVEYAEAIVLGPGTDPASTMGPLANERRVEAMERIVEDARAQGARVETGGRRWKNTGFFFQPTVLTQVPESALVMHEEPFGPVAPIVPFGDVADAIGRANALPYGLAAYAFTRSAATAAQLGDGLRAGMVGINTLAVSHPETPFGGVKESGMGREGGSEGLQAYLDVKLVSLDVS